MTQTPAGWYPSDGGERFWDGQAWTEQRRPAQGPPPPMGPPPKKKHTLRNVLLGIGVALVLLIGGCTAIIGSAVDSATNDSGSGTSAGAADDETPAPAPKAKSKAKSKPAKPALTSGQSNALRAGKNYLSFAPFSKKGLIKQLSSSAGDGYPVKDAVYAANHVGANWNEQAAKAAKNYLDLTPFSRDGLIKQLSSSAGDQYTLAQAEYGATKAGLK